MIFFHFNVPNIGKTKLEAVAGDLRDESVINKVDTFDESYRLIDKNAILNWFDITEKKGYCSLNTAINDIMETESGKLFIDNMIKNIMKQRDEKEAKEEDKDNAGGFKLTDSNLPMVGGYTILRMSSMSSILGIEFTREQLLDMNKELNNIPLVKK